MLPCEASICERAATLEACGRCTAGVSCVSMLGVLLWPLNLPL